MALVLLGPHTQTLAQSIQTAIKKKYHRLRSLNNQQVFLTVLEAGKVKDQDVGR